MRNSDWTITRHHCGRMARLRQRTDGGAGTTFHVKESGSATNTGWVGK